MRRIFFEMLTVGSPVMIAKRLTDEGVTTKAWTTKTGTHRTGGKMEQKYLHKLLRNRIYLGELSHKGSWYPGAHPSIIDQELWDKVHAVLARDGRERAQETIRRRSVDALLRGILYDPTGDRMYSTYTRKAGKQYRYYISQRTSRFGTAGQKALRLPAAEIEAAVVGQIRSVLASPEAIAAVVQDVQREGAPLDEATVAMAMGKLNTVWDQLFPVDRYRITNLMIERVDLVDGDEGQGIRIAWRELGWRALIGEFTGGTIGAEMVEVE